MNRIGCGDIDFKDCLQRANKMASATSHSGVTLNNKDLRRVIFLVNRYEQLTKENKRLRIALECAENVLKLNNNFPKTLVIIERALNPTKER